MDLTLNILTGFGGALIVLWVLLWTFIRWQRIVNNKEAAKSIKNIWWLLLLLGLVLLIAALGLFATK